MIRRCLAMMLIVAQCVAMAHAFGAHHRLSEHGDITEAHPCADHHDHDAVSWCSTGDELETLTEVPCEQLRSGRGLSAFGNALELPLTTTVGSRPTNYAAPQTDQRAAILYRAPKASPPTV